MCKCSKATHTAHNPYDKVRRFCDQLDALPAYIAEHGRNQAVINTIAGIVRYFDLAGPAHHQDEEDELFPLILARQPDAAPKIEQLLGEHGYLHSRWNAIRDDLLAYNAAALDDISAEEVHEFARLYREHAAREEQWLFPHRRRADQRQRASTGRPAHGRAPYPETGGLNRPARSLRPTLQAMQ